MHPYIALLMAGAMLSFLASCGVSDQGRSLGASQAVSPQSPEMETDGASGTIDGNLDCREGSGTFEGSLALTERTQGAATAAKAIREALSGYADEVGREIRIVNRRTGSVVADGREIVTTQATDTADGWFAFTVRGCSSGSASESAEAPG